jgi:hypothetical protein
LRFIIARNKRMKETGASKSVLPHSVLKSRRLRWVSNIAHTGKTRNT